MVSSDGNEERKCKFPLQEGTLVISMQMKNAEAL